MPKIKFPNLCKLIQDIIIIPASTDFLNIGNVERKGGKSQTFEYLKNEKSFLDEIKKNCGHKI